MRRLLTSRSGASAVEMALALPLLLLLLLPSMDFALAFSAQMRLNSAATRAAELATGSGKVLPSYSFLQAEAASASRSSTASASVTNWLECNGVQQSNSNGLCASGATFARYVRVTVTDTYQPMFRIGGYFGNARTLQGVATVRVQ